MTNDEPDSRLCESLLLPDNVFLLWTDRKKGRQQQMEGGRGGGRKNPLHCTQESTCSALWECLDISSNDSAWEKKEKSSSMLWLQPAGAKGLAPVWHKQTHTQTHTQFTHAQFKHTHTHVQTQTITLLLMFDHKYTPPHAQCRSFFLSVCVCVCVYPLLSVWKEQW